jgi:hypothetical protein
MSAANERDRGARRFSGRRVEQARMASGKSFRQIAGETGRGPDDALALAVEVDELCEDSVQAVEANRTVERPLHGSPDPLARRGQQEVATARPNATDPVHDPCEPVLVPGGRGRFVICGRTHGPDGEHILDTKDGSG